MRFELYNDPTIFYNVIKPTTSQESNENELMLGLTNIIISDPNHYSITPFLATVEDKGKIMLCAFMTPPWSLLVHGHVDCPDECYEILIEHMIDKKLSIPSVNGKTETSKRFADIWCEKNQNQSKIHMEMRLFILKELNRIENVSGRLMQADMSHYDLLSHWMKQFNLETHLTGEDEYIKKHVRFIIQSQNAFIWYHGDEPVSMTFRERPHGDGIAIGYVFTPKELRNNGYAMSCVASVTKKTLNEGYSYCSLFTDLANPISNSIYQKIGYRPVCDYTYYDFK